jgi:hypothetical protein
VFWLVSIVYDIGFVIVIVRVIDYSQCGCDETYSR